MLYGKKGFIEYQFQIPFGKEEYIAFVLTKMKEYNAFSFLTVLKSIFTGGCLGLKAGKLKGDNAEYSPSSYLNR